MSGRRLDTSVTPPIAIACGVAALAARPTASLSALLVTVAVGVMGAVVVGPARGVRLAERRTTVAALTVGAGAFLLARAMHPLPWTPFTLFSLTASVAAAVAEELFFRKLVYGWLARWGVPLAIGGAAAAFAAVHVPAYGVAALPVDLAAGVLLGWQRWATGGWTIPALTHSAANLLQFLR